MYSEIHRQIATEAIDYFETMATRDDVDLLFYRVFPDDFVSQAVRHVAPKFKASDATALIVTRAIQRDVRKGLIILPFTPIKRRRA